jgi:SAUR family protein
MVLVDEEDNDDQGQKIMVHISTLREPCMAALLDMAEQQFGHNGVLRIPCNVIHFDHMMSMLKDPN